MAPKHQSHFSPKHPDSHMQSEDVQIIIIIPYLQKRLPNTVLKPTKEKVLLLLSYFRLTEMLCTLILAGGRPAGGRHFTEVNNKIHSKENFIKSPFGDIQKCAHEYL